MLKKLVIVESPNKIKSISKYLGPEYKVIASIGHFRDIPKKELGIDIENNFKPKYVITNKDVVKQLKEDAELADEIILATDPDREGEAIAWHIKEVLKSYKKSFKRVCFYEITEKTVKEAIKKAGAIDENLVQAQQARRSLDRLVGYKLSPILQKNFKGDKVSAGRVQSVALKLICDRYEEREVFKEEGYWRILGEFQRADFLFTAALQKIEIKSAKEAAKLTKKLKKLTYQITSFDKKEKKKRPLPPFTTCTLQQEATSLGFSSEKTMQLAQKLYEKGYITYHRTDSYRINEDFQYATLNYIKDRFGKDYLPSIPQSYVTKDTSQDAHEAIRPTELNFHYSGLPGEEKALYKLIVYRYIASQMADAVYDTWNIEVQDEEKKYLFKMNYAELKFQGFLALYDEENRKHQVNMDIPELKEGEKVELLNIKEEQCFTQPPPLFTEKTLIKALEKAGVGRPSTYASILSTIRKRNYVDIKEKAYYPTELGKKLNQQIKEDFSDVINTSFTAEMEGYLDEVAKGKYTYLDAMKFFYEPFLQVFKKASISNQKIISNCPKCQKGSVVLKNTTKGIFYGCSNYPTCTFSLPGIYRGIAITEEIIKKLIQEKKSSRLTFKKKDTAGTYAGIIKLNDNYQLDFEFEKRNKVMKILTSIFN